MEVVQNSFSSVWAVFTASMTLPAYVSLEGGSGGSLDPLISHPGVMTKPGMESVVDRVQMTGVHETEPPRGCDVFVFAKNQIETKRVVLKRVMSSLVCRAEYGADKGRLSALIRAGDYTRMESEAWR